jgi:hypothetical protein
LKAITDIDVEQNFRYDHNFAFELWKDFQRGVVSINDLLTYLKRFVVIQLRRRKFNIEEKEVVEELVHYALLAVWEAASRGNIPTEDQKQFHGYLHGVIRNGTANGLKAGVWLSEVVKYDDATYHMSRYLKRVPCPQDVEDRLYLEEIPGVVRERVMASMRFPVRHGAVKYIVDRFFTHQRVSHNWLRKFYKISDPSFLVQHVRIRVKMVLMELQRDLEYPSIRPYEKAVYGSLSDGPDRPGSE